MAGDRCNFPHMFFLPQASQVEDAWQPRADVYRTHEGWLVKLELAGVRPDEIRLAAEGPRLLVQGARRDEHCLQGMGCHCMEIAYSRFQRVLELPGLSESGRDRDVVRRRHATGTDQDGVRIVTSENPVVVEAETGIAGILAGAAAEEFRSVPSLVHAALGRPAVFAWRPWRRFWLPRKRRFWRWPSRTPMSRYRPPTTSTPLAPGPSSRRWLARGRESSCLVQGDRARGHGPPRADRALSQGSCPTLAAA